VLTRLPGDLRLEPGDAARLLAERFAPSLLLAAKTTRRLADTFARLDISVGAVYDALVALAAVEHDAELATRDARARATYEAVGARVVIAA
jgi:predicted nucleic acid-binding protein